MVNSSKECEEARDLFDRANIPYVLYNIDEHNSGCCGGYEGKVPVVFAPEGIFRGLDGIKSYIELSKNREKESESAYW